MALRNARALHCCYLLVTIIVFTLTALYLRVGVAPLHDLMRSEQELSAPQLGSQWPGWDGIKHMVVFGDSITASKFNVTGDQPSETNPIGNPAFPGNTSSIGENWISYMTASYNATFLKTINLATGGATVDEEVVNQMWPEIPSFKVQVADLWLMNYVPPSSLFPWSPDDTL